VRVVVRRADSVVAKATASTGLDEDPVQRSMLDGLFAEVYWCNPGKQEQDKVTLRECARSIGLKCLL